MDNEIYYVLYVTSLFVSIVGIAIAFPLQGWWSRLIATALCIPISLLPARYHPSGFLISIFFPLLVYRGLALAHKGRYWRGALYCGPFIALDVLLIFFTFPFEAYIEHKQAASIVSALHLNTLHLRYHPI